MTTRKVHSPVSAHRISKLYAATNKVRKETGKRSGLEVQIASHLVASGAEFEEEKDIKAIVYRSRREKKYHPDFRLKNGIIIEAKGWFKPADREKHLCIKYQRPDLDIRFVFSRSASKLGKGSATTYAIWCQKNGFLYADKQIPEAWIEEPPKVPEVRACQTCHLFLCSCERRAV
jgi:hypothetical protein